MAELSTVARPYAEAIFAVARDDKAGLASWADQIQRLAEVFDVEAVRVAMTDPRLNDGERTSVFLGLVQPPVDKTLTTFVELLVSNDRLMLLPQISSHFRLKEPRRVWPRPTSPVHFRCPTSRSRNCSSLNPNSVSKLKSHVQIDAALIGGVRVQVGDRARIRPCRHNWCVCATRWPSNARQ